MLAVARAANRVAFRRVDIDLEESGCERLPGQALRPRYAPASQGAWLTPRCSLSRRWPKEIYGITAMAVDLGCMPVRKVGGASCVSAPVSELMR